MSLRLHILGASGSGTTTLGADFASSLGIPHFDTDSFYWAPSNVPFTVKRTVEERLKLMEETIPAQGDWVLSGSMCGWGDAFIPLFTHVVFLYVPWDVRRDRLIEREQQRHGNEALSPGGIMHAVHEEFLDWASRYESAGHEQRSYTTHDQWLRLLPVGCHVLRVEEEQGIAGLVELVHEWVRMTS